MNGGSIEVIAGLNLPLLVKLAKVRGEKPMPRRRERSQGGRPQVY